MLTVAEMSTLQWLPDVWTKTDRVHRKFCQVLICKGLVEKTAGWPVMYRRTSLGSRVAAGDE